MATDLEKLIVQLSADIKGYEREMRKAMGVTNAEARKIENRYRQMNRNLDAIGRSSARALIAPLAGIGAALSVREVARYADAWTVAGNKIAAAGAIAGRQGRSLEEINVIANLTRSGIAETTDLYAKLLRSTAAVADSEEQVARATEIVNKAFKAGGAAASEQAAGILQLSQALGSGLLQGDELRSLRENAPLLAKAIADEFKTTIAGLKDLGAEGKLTTDRVFKAILNAQPEIEKAFASTNQTIADGLTRVNNAMTQYIGQTDEGLSASQRLVAGLNTLADNFDTTADIVLKLAAIIAGALVGRAIGGMIASLGLGVTALARFTSAVRAATTMAGLATAMGGLSAAAGPLGLVIGTTVVGALALFSTESAEATAAARTYAEALAEVEAAAEKVPTAVEKAAEAISEKTANLLAGGIEEGRDQISDLTSQIMDEMNAFIVLMENMADLNLVSNDQLDQLRALKDDLDAGKAEAGKTEQALYALANSNPRFQNLADSLSPLLAALSNAIAATDLLQQKQAALAGGMSPAAIGAYRQYGRSRAEGEEMLRLGKAFADEAQRQNSLSKEQLAVEREIARIRKELAKDGGFLPDSDIEALARDNIRADSRRSSSGGSRTPKTADNRFDEDLQNIRDRTAALIQEREALSLSFMEQTKRSLALDLEQQALRDVREEARRKGDQDWQNAELSPEQVAAIDEVADAYARQADELRKASEAMELQRDVMRGAFSDLRSALSDGKLEWQELADVALNALDKIIDKILDDLINAILEANRASGGGGGIIGFLANMFGLGGGVRLPSRAPIPTPRPASQPLSAMASQFSPAQMSSLARPVASPVNMRVDIQNNAQASVSVGEPRRGPDGAMSLPVIINQIEDKMVQSMNSGKLGRAAQSTYGLKRITR